MSGGSVTSLPMREVEGRNKSREIWYFKTLAHGVGGESKRGSKGKRREERDESMEKRKELEGRRRTGKGGEGRREEELCRDAVPPAGML